MHMLCLVSRRFRMTYQRHSLLFQRKKSEKNINPYFTTKEIRKMFIDYFVEQKHHVYIHSSPVILNNDPSLLFVNAGMNQFKSKLLDRVPPLHRFYHLKRAANSQKCIRVSGKHSDLDSVGHDLHHHTFFEMLGNWSFGDYFKAEACKQSWYLLTEVYGLPKNKLYVTYFSGDGSLGLPCDEETQNIWLDIGLPESHILPFGLEDNFWDMGTTGPCGPCTEIHYRMSENGKLDLREIWNLVFIQYKRDKDGTLQPLSHTSVDTGMGLERLSAVIQGKKATYDIDLFVPLFHAIEKVFAVRPYTGQVGESDTDHIDTAYRILVDHMRMVAVAIADGVFPDCHDAGHVLRRIIRRAAYAANKYMKSHPGALSELIPYVAETLDFFPEVGEKTSEIIEVVNEEERALHKLINRGRKIRNRMMKELKDGILDGNKTHELHVVCGLDQNIIDGLASEVNLRVDWEDYKRILEKEAQGKSALGDSTEKCVVSSEVIKAIQADQVPLTDDSYKYYISLGASVKDGVPSVSASVCSIVKDGKIVNFVEMDQNCIIVTDKTNFYSNAGGQIADVGKILSENFEFSVKDVHFINGYIFHEGEVTQGRVGIGSPVIMSVDKDHRAGCAQNHTATHLLNAALRKIIPYTTQQSSYVGPKSLRFGFISRNSLSLEQIAKLESDVNQVIHQKLPVHRIEMSLEDAQALSGVTFVQGEEYPDMVSVIKIGCMGNDSAQCVSVEPCCGTHVTNTGDIEYFAFTKSKSLGGSVKALTAVSGRIAEEVLSNGGIFKQHVSDIQEKFNQLKDKGSVDDCTHLLKEVKEMLHGCSKMTNIPLIILKESEITLQNIKFWLIDYLDSVQHESSMGEYEDEVTMAKKSCSESELLHTLQQYVQEKVVPSTNDFHKYRYQFRNRKAVVNPISAVICEILHEGIPVQEIAKGYNGVLVTDETNFYAEFDGQEGDKGTIIGKDFHFDVTNVYSVKGHIFHEGWVREGVLRNSSEAMLFVDADHRHSCCLNHTAAHLLNSAVKKLLPQALMQSTFSGSSYLEIRFKSKNPLSLDLVKSLEELVNSAIQKDLAVRREEVSSNELRGLPYIRLPKIEGYAGQVPVISIGDDRDDSPLISVEPCFGTHAFSTSDIEKLIITSSKGAKNMEKIIRAVTGTHASTVIKNGRAYDEDMSYIEAQAARCLDSEEQNFLEMWNLIKEIKVAKVRHEVDLPVVLFRNHQETLSELTSRLQNRTKTFVQQGFAQVKSEMKDVLHSHKDAKFIVHKINSLGDGKKIINYALSCVKDKPALFIAADGSRNIICSCSVPQALATSSFSALLWIQPVGIFLRGKARSHSKDPVCYYSIESNDVTKVDEALEIAKKYAESNL